MTPQLSMARALRDMAQLRQQGYHSAREVFLAVADANKQVAVYPVST